MRRFRCRRGPRPAARNERRRRALELRKAGATYEQIALQPKYTDKANARRDIRRALRDIIEEDLVIDSVVNMEASIALLDAMSIGSSAGNRRRLAIVNPREISSATYVDTVGVVGSIPIAPTTTPRDESPWSF